MINTATIQNNIQNPLFKDFTRPTAAKNAAAQYYNQNSDSFIKKNNTAKQKPFYRRAYEYLTTPIENPQYKKGVIGAKPTTTRFEKYGGYVLTALAYAFLFYVLRHNIKSMKAAEMSIAGAASKERNVSAFMDKYREDLTHSSELKDLALPDVLKGTVGRLMNKIKDPQSFIQKGGTNKNTILLYGPPGTGKTTVAKAIAKAIENAELFSVDLSTVQGMYVGESQANLDKIIRNICQYAKENPLKKIVVLMDEFDSVAMKDNGSTNQQYHASLLNVLKRGISEKLTQHDNIILIATTNAELNKTSGTEFVQKLDSAIADRFGEQIRVEKPTKEQFIKAMVHHYKGLSKVEDSLKDEGSSQVAQIANDLASNGCTFRSLENLFNASAAASKEDKLTFKDILSVLSTCIESTKSDSRAKIGF